MSLPSVLFEVSWEVAHKVGGVHTAISTRCRLLAERLGDRLLLVGPWRLSGSGDEIEPDPALDAFAEGCRHQGLPVRAGRWKVPGRPRALLVESSGLRADKDRILEALWKDHRVDSLHSDWEHAEQVLFGIAAGRVVERWWKERAAREPGTAVAVFHEWRAGAGLLHLRTAVPEIGTALVVHSTALGQALGRGGADPLDALGTGDPDAVAGERGVRAAHSLEVAVARVADRLAAVSDGVAAEAHRFLGRAADLVLGNGLDPVVLEVRLAGREAAATRASVLDLASRLLAADLRGADLLVVAGRHELAGKGIDLAIDALGEVNRAAGPPVLVLFLVPTVHGGVRPEVADRLAGKGGAGPLPGLSTHALAEPARDEIARRGGERGLQNAVGSRVRVLHVPAYLDGRDGVFDRPYEAVVRAADLTLFPSAYDAWGYAPQESLALGVPTVTSDLAGFGRWLLARGRGPTDGAFVLRRAGRAEAAAREELVAYIESFLARPRAERPDRATCRAAVAGSWWSDLLPRQEEMWAQAAAAAVQRSGGAAWRSTAPAPADVVAAVPSPAPRVRPLRVAAVLPPPLAPLARLARNWCFAWLPDVEALFAEIDPDTWESCRHDPARLLDEAPAAALAARATDASFLARLARAAERARDYLAGGPPATDESLSAGRPVAYFCAEYGLHESLPAYSGGLGILAGDHLKAASDLGIPVVAVGILYRHGYFRQRLAGGVDQAASPDEFDPARLPLDLVADAGGRPVEAEVPLPGALLRLRAWRAAVGRATLFLLDADHEGNPPEHRAVTRALYGGSGEDRLRQEVVLGRGGVRLLARLGIEPAVVHLNEGHAAFVAVERASRLVREEGLTFDEALEVVRESTVFTTHTPVPAGHDRFDEDLLRRHLGDCAEWLGVGWERLFALGAAPAEPGRFNMTRLGIETAGFVNGVSRRHAEVTRGIVATLAPHLAVRVESVAAVTNGVHLPSWTAPEIVALLAPGDRPVAGTDFAERAHALDLAALHGARRALKARLRCRVERRLRRSFQERRDDPRLLERTLAGLDEGALWIGFARRFATYKRGDLFLTDPARLRALLDAPGRPVRILVAGKAHPNDEAARDLLARVARAARTDEFAGRVVVVEDYDIDLARALVSGVDLWLNTPRPPMEASGTSGMKAAANGVLNLSVGDGWWLEAYDGTNGWRIGDPEAGEASDAAVASALYRLLEDEVVPLFFRRDERGLPREWLERCRRSLATIPPAFDAARMAAQYRDEAYRPMARRSLDLSRDRHAGARRLAADRARLRRALADVRCEEAVVGGPDGAVPGAPVPVRTDLALGSLRPDELLVDCVVGRPSPSGLLDPTPFRLSPTAPGRFEGTILLPRAGDWGWTLRLRPSSDSSSLHSPVSWP